MGRQLGRTGSGLAGEGVFTSYWMSEKVAVCQDQSWPMVIGQAGSSLQLGPGRTGKGMGL